MTLNAAAVVVLVLALAVVHPSYLPPPPSPASFPVVAGGTAGSGTYSSQHLVVANPYSAPTPNVNDLMLFVICFGGTVDINPVPANWTQIIAPGSWGSGPGGNQCQAFTHLANATEPHTFTVTIPFSANLYAYQIYLIQGNHVPLTINTASGSQTLDPPSITPSGGPLDFLIITTLFDQTNTIGSGGISKVPADYTSIMGTTGSNVTQMVMNGAYRQVNITTENPGVFTLWGGNSYYGPAVFAIRPKFGAVVTTGAASPEPTSASATITLNWAFSNVISLTFDYGLSAGNLNHTTAARVVSTTGTSTITISGLTENTTYFYRAHSVETPSGYQGYGSILNFTTTTDPSQAIYAKALSAFWIILFLTVLGLLVIGAWVVRSRYLT